MATRTWLGGSSLHADPNDATDPLNWIGGLLPQAGDSIVVPAGSTGAGVTLDLIGQPGTAQFVDASTILVAGPFDTLAFADAVITSTAIVAGAGAAAGQGFVLSLTDSLLDGVSIEVADHATLDLAGSSSTAMQITSDGGQSTITQSGTGDALVLNATGTVSTDLMLWLTSAGGQTAVNIAQASTSAAGFLQFDGPVLNLGGTLTVNGDSNTGTRLSNSSLMLIDGANAAALDRLNARMNGISGELVILGDAHGATLDINTNMPGAQIITFADSGGVLKVESGTTLGSPFNAGTIATTVLQNLFSRIDGFRPGDTIDLAGIDPTGLAYTYGDDANYGNSLLVLTRGTDVVARVRLQSLSFAEGSGTFGGAETGNFHLASDGAGGTAITVANTQTVSSNGTTVVATGTLAAWGGVTNGATTDWSAANWSGGTGGGGLPGQFQTAQISLTAAEVAAIAASGTTPYVLTIASAEAAGAVSLDDPQAQLLISAPLTVAGLTGALSGGGFTANQGRVEIATGGSLAGTRAYFGGSTHLTIDAGGQLALAGTAGFTLGSGLAGLDVEGLGGVQGGTVASAGNVVVGQNSGAVLNVSNDVVSNTGTSIVYGTQGASVVASYTQVGGSVLAGADSGQSTLDIAGAQTSYSDVGGDASTPFSGALIVGGGNLTVNGLGQISFSNGGSGLVSVQDGATLSEASYALLGAVRNSSGTVSVSGGAQWIIGAGTVTPVGSIVVGNTITGTATLFSSNLPWLGVGSGGTGLLSINSGTVQLGTGELFNTPKVMIGIGNAGNNAATGSVDVQGAGALLDSGGGPLVVGQRSDAVLTVGNGGSVHVGAASATTDLGFGLAIGNRSGTVGAVSGMVTIQAGGALTDDGDLVVGRDSTGVLAIESGGSLGASGGLYLGGQRSLNNGTVGITPTLVRGQGSGTLTLSGANARLAVGAIADMWQGSTIALSGDATFTIGGATASPGMISVGAGATLQGAGLISVASGSSTLFNLGTVMAGGLTSSGTASQIGSTLEIAAALGGAGVFSIASGGLLQLDSDVPAGTQFSFASGGTLVETIRVMSPAAFQGAVSGLYGGSRHIDLAGATLSGGGQLTYTANVDPTTGGTVSLPTSLGSVSFTVSGWHPGGFSIASDLAGGTLIGAVDAAPCFTVGTAILTAAGERPVETLRPGELVPVLDGRLSRVVWVGRTRVDIGRHRDPQAAAPVRICAGALADGVPRRDLVVSPDHALWTDGVLVPAYLLVNGMTVRRELDAGIAEYVHVELDRHGLLLAEGAPAESYLDTGNRGLFAGEPGARELHPDMLAAISARAWDERACATLVLGGPRVAAAHGRIAARAFALGHRLSEDPALAVLAGGRRLGGLGPAGGRVLVPAGTEGVWLMSRHTVPRHRDSAHDDSRRLGVAVLAVRFAGQEIDLSGGAFGPGFHAAEGDGRTRLRWTDGAAKLRLPAYSDAAWLELDLAPGVLRYEVKPAA